MNPSSAVLVLFFSSVGWGLTWWPLKALAEQGMGGSLVVTVAFGAASVVLLPFVIREFALWKGALKFIALIMLLGGFANLTFQVALQEGEVIRVMILFYLMPVWSALGGRVFLAERIDLKRVICIMTALTGAFLILGGPAVLSAPPSWLDLLAIGAGMGFAMNNIAFRATPTLPIVSKVAAVFAGSVILGGSYLLFFSTEPLPVISTELMGITIIYGIFWLMLITFGTQWAVTHLEAGRAAIIMIMELVAAVISASLILGETLSLMEMFGGALVVAAAMTESMRGDEASPTPVAEQA